MQTKFFLTLGSLLACVLLNSRATAQEMPFMTSGATQNIGVGFEHSDTSHVMRVEEERGFINVPLWKGERDSFAAMVKGQRVTLGEHLVIGDRHLTIPRDFGSADINASWLRETESGTQHGLSAGIGVSGRSLTDGDESQSYSLNYFTKWKADNGNSWFFFLSYSNNRSTFNNIPFPGLAYGINGASYRVIVGAPFVMVAWFPRSYFFNMALSPFSASADAAVTVYQPIQATASFSWTPRSYQNITPNVDKERLLYDKKEWAAGAKASFGPATSIALLYIYDFDRRLFVGESLTKRRSNAVDLADSGGFAIRLRAAF